MPVMSDGPTGALLILVVVSAAAHLFAWYRGVIWLEYLAKPATTTLLIVIASLVPSGDATYRALIVAGLICSLAGDVFLMLPGHRFVAGLVSFLLAHVFYIAAFSIGVGLGVRPLLLLPFLIPAVLVLGLLWPHLEQLKIPVVVYMAVLIGMAWQACARAMELGTAAAIAAAVGAGLFVISDATLALNRFRRPFRAAQAIVMATYVIAQAFIAFSIE